MFQVTKNKFPKQECFQGQDNLVILADSIFQINKWHLMFMVQKAIFSVQNIRPSVCPSVRLYVFPSVRPSICMYTVYRQPLRHLQEDHEVILAYRKIRLSVYIFIVQIIFQQTIFLVCLSVHPVYPFYIFILFSTLVQDNFEQKQTLTKSLTNPFGNNYCYNFRTIKKNSLSVHPSVRPFHLLIFLQPRRLTFLSRISRNYISRLSMSENKLGKLFKPLAKNKF